MLNPVGERIKPRITQGDFRGNGNLGCRVLIIVLNRRP